MTRSRNQETSSHAGLGYDCVSSPLFSSPLLARCLLRVAYCLLYSRRYYCLQTSVRRRHVRVCQYQYPLKRIKCKLPFPHSSLHSRPTQPGVPSRGTGTDGSVVLSSIVYQSTTVQYSPVQSNLQYTRHQPFDPACPPSDGCSLVGGVNW